MLRSLRKKRARLEDVPCPRVIHTGTDDEMHCTRNDKARAAARVLEHDVNAVVILPNGARVRINPDREVLAVTQGARPAMALADDSKPGEKERERKRKSSQDLARRK